MKVDYRDQNNTLIFRREDVKSNKDIEKITIYTTSGKFTCYVHRSHIVYLVQHLLVEACFINSEDKLLEFRDINIPFQFKIRDFKKQ